MELMLNEPPIGGAGSQSLAALNILSNVFVQLFVRLTPWQSLLCRQTDGIVLADEIEHLLHSAAQRQVIRVHHQQDHVFELRNALSYL